MDGQRMTVRQLSLALLGELLLKRSHWRLGETGVRAV
jgi:hypothetical protein